MTGDGRAGARAMAVDRWVLRWAIREPDRPAVVFEGRTTSYGELEHEVSRAAGWLRSRGVAPGDRVACVFRNHPAVVALFLACSRVGAVFVPWNARSAPGELDLRFRDAAPVLVLVQEALVDRAPGRSGPWVVAGDPPPWAGETAASSGEAGTPAGPGAPQVILYTSGTTGRPKGAVLPVRKGFFNALNALEFLDLGQRDRVLLVLPLFHSGGLFIQLVPALYAGCTVLLHPRFDPDAVLRAVRDDGATQLLAVPTLLRRLLDAGGADVLGRLRACGVGGEPVPEDLIRTCTGAGIGLRQLMGQTESSIFLWAAGRELVDRPGTVGRPVRHAEVGLFDGRGEAVGPGRDGELWVRGPTVMTGYWNDPVATVDALRGGWLRTGDLARRDRDGFHYLVGRAKDLYISGGENVYPAEVEAVLRQHPDVAEAAVVAVPDPEWGEAGYAFVEPRPGTAPDPDALAVWCADRLARFKCPRRVMVCPALPRTPLGKVRKADLRARVPGTG